MWPMRLTAGVGVSSRAERLRGSASIRATRRYRSGLARARTSPPFQQDDVSCQASMPSYQSGGTASAQAATSNAVGTAVVGTASWSRT